MHVYMYRYTRGQNVHGALTNSVKDGAGALLFKHKCVSKTKKKLSPTLKQKR
jgi:hypothetical protein